MFTPWDNLPHTVYQYFNGAGELLYVGCTCNLARRERQHHSKPWWPTVARRETETFRNRCSGQVAEQALIEYYQPRYNILRKVHQSDLPRFELDMAIAREPHRLVELMRQFNDRYRNEIEAEAQRAEAERKQWKRTMRRLNESRSRAAYLSELHASRQPRAAS